MSKQHFPDDIPIKSAVIAWQPKSCHRSVGGAAPGEVAVFERGDPREVAYAMADGASWVDWADHPNAQLVEALNQIKRLMVRTHRIPIENVEAAYSRIPEYRKWRKGSGHRARKHSPS